MEIKRGFGACYYNEFPFIEYSIKKDAVFCFSCRNFVHFGYEDEKFTKFGLQNWKKLKEKLQKHTQSSCHKRSYKEWISYKSTKTAGTILDQLDNSNKDIKEKNREYLFKIIDIIKFLAKQGLAFRGHDEQENSGNKGNFLELCTLFAKYDQNFNQRFIDTFSMTSNRIQNDLLNICLNKF